MACLGGRLQRAPGKEGERERARMRIGEERRTSEEGVIGLNASATPADARVQYLARVSFSETRLAALGRKP